MGKIASPYGVRGWTKVISYTDPIDNLLNYPDLLIQHRNQWQLIRVEKGKVHGKWLIVKLTGCDDREKVKEYTNNAIAILHEQFNPLKTKEYYWNDLIGLTVTTEAGIEVGTIDSLMETGSNDVIVIKDSYNRQILIPYIKQVVKSINLENKIMTVDWDIEA